MKQLGKVSLAFVLLIGMAATAQAEYIYKWVKDKHVSSDKALKPAQASRVIALSETATLDMVRRVLTDDMYFALAAYHKTRHRQDAETTGDTVLPEEIVGQQEIDLVDDDYRFILEVRLKDYNGRTRVMAKASPMYRIRDLDAEAQINPNAANRNVDIHVSAAPGAAVAVSAFVPPFDGVPADYQIFPLPDAAARAGKIVRSFMYLLDQRVATVKPAASTGGASKASVTQDKDGTVTTEAIAQYGE